MVITKTNPRGIDRAIQAIQVGMYDYLSALWNVDDYDCYGRCYRNQKEEGYVPEVYKGGKDYADLYVDDRLSAISFFGSEKSSYELINTADVHLIFFVNIKTLKPNIAHRADEEVRNDVQKYLIETQSVYGTPITTITGIQNVFQEYTGYRSIDSIKFTDMHPFHCFRINFTIRYDDLFTC